MTYIELGHVVSAEDMVTLSKSSREKLAELASETGEMRAIFQQIQDAAESGNTCTRVYFGLTIGQVCCLRKLGFTATPSGGELMSYLIVWR